MGGPSSGMAHFSATKRRRRGVVRAVLRGEVSGCHTSPYVMEIWAMRDDGPPSGRCVTSGFLRERQIERFGLLSTLSAS
jgi:hypothetical protein